MRRSSPRIHFPRGRSFALDWWAKVARTDRLRSIKSLSLEGVEVPYAS